MTADQTSQILAFVTEHPRSTAAEAGITVPRMQELENAGLVKRSGKRMTGKKGKPPYEWVAASVEVPDFQGAPIVINAITKIVTPERVEAHSCHCDFEGITDAVKLTKMGGGCKDPQFACPVLDAVRREVNAKTPAAQKTEDEDA